ncbi:MAG: biotin--[Paludibacteraceae bacterium]|nr:biotin--[acetyl-CoA-carboxylase] ligase [Paludibacteraceae bacterium]
MPMQEYIAQTDSTNNRLKERLAAGEELGEGYTLYTFYQTAGRGQAGNSWESEAGQNLLFSTVFRLTDLQPQEQFRLSMLVPLAIVRVLCNVVADEGLRSLFTVKWPNDIYAGDGKLAGILIEHRLTGSRIDASVAGVGLNVNQTVFRSGAPNPVSLRQLTGREYDKETLLQRIVSEFARLRPLLHEPEELKRQYMQVLYRREGYFPYVERTVSLAPTQIATAEEKGVFYARMVDVTDTGQLVLQDKQNNLRTYHFKEVRFVL